MSDDSTKPAKPDWERIEGDYRAGLLSLREIAAKDGQVTEGAIRKRAKKLGWSRDLGARIAAKADDLVRKEAVRNDGTQLTTANPTAERQIVDANAEAIAKVRLAHRSDISQARLLCRTMFEELSTLADPVTVGLLEQLLDQVSPDDAEDVAKAITKTKETLAKATSLPGRAATLKALSDSLKTFVTLEREAWGLVTEKPEPTGKDGTPLRAVIVNADVPDAEAMRAYLEMLGVS